MIASASAAVGAHTPILRSNRPERHRESGSLQISFTVAITNTSVSFTSSIPACTATYSGASQRELSSLANLSMSSRKRTEGASSFAFANACAMLLIKASPPLSRRTVTVFSPHSSMKQFAKRLLPKPGSPYSSSPWGKRAPISS